MRAQQPDVREHIYRQSSALVVPLRPLSINCIYCLIIIVQPVPIFYVENPSYNDDDDGGCDKIFEQVVLDCCER